MPVPFVSVVIPCRNEAAFIADCLASVMSSDFPKDRLEVLVVDGMSDDGTRAIAAAHSAANASIRVLDNPDRYTPFALNIGIRSAKGEIIVRLDAHSTYPRDYITQLVDWLARSGADNVGGVCRTRPANDTPKARAIALALSHWFGVGNSYFRIGTAEPRWVDTVPFGCYRREVFDRIGLFDEDLVRNQDDELNARLIRRGGRILLVPAIVSEYFARESLAKVWRTYYQYGYFKPLVARKVGAVLTVRQLVPGLFVIAVLAGFSLAWPFAIVRVPFAVMLIAYAAADLGCALHAAWPQELRSTLWLTLVFPVVHVGYGLGFLRGLVDFWVRNRRPDGRVRAVAPSR